MILSIKMLAKRGKINSLTHEWGLIKLIAEIWLILIDIFDCATAGSYFT